MNFFVKNHGSFVSTRGLGRLIGALLLLAVGVRAESVDLNNFKDDIRQLSGKITEYKYQLKQTKDGSDQLDALESGLVQLKDSVAQMEDVAGDLDSADSHLKYLKDVELDSKEREVARVRQMFEQSLQQLNDQSTALGREIEAHNAQPHEFTP